MNLNKTAWLCLLLLLFATHLAFSQISVGIEAGGGYLINDVEGSDPIDKIAIPVLAVASYELPFTYTAKGHRLQAGIAAGWMRLFTATQEFGGSTYTAQGSTIPVLAFAQTRISRWFFRLGGGVHLWNIAFETDHETFDASTLDENGIAPAAVAAVGYTIPLGERWSLDLGVHGYIVGYESDAGENDANVASALIGVNHAF